MSKTARYIFVLCLLVFGMANAASISKSGSGSLSISGSTARYSHVPGGAVASPNSGYQVQSSSPLGVLLQKPLSPNASAGMSVFEELLRKPLLINAIASPKSLSKALVNPWTFVASAALQPTLSYLADQACIRIAGGQMTNTGGLWEECIIRENAKAFFRVNQDDSTITDGMLSSCSHWASSQGVYISTPVQVVGDYSGIPSSASANWSSDGMPSCLFKYQNTFNGQPIGSEYPRSARLEIKIAQGVERTDWEPASSVQVAAKIEQVLTANPSLQPSVFNELFGNNIPIDVESPVVSGPTSVTAGDPVTTVKTNSDGSTETSTQQTVRNFSYSGDTIINTSNTTTNVTNNTSNNTTTTTTTNAPTNAPNPNQKDIETCGLPGKPACKIDETGTPGIDSPPNVNTVFDSVKTCLQNPSSCFPAFPELSWAFSIPTGCSPIPTPGFSPYLQSIDICPFQSIFHDLMSMIWLAAGLFGASAMLFRDSQGA